MRISNPGAIRGFWHDRAVTEASDTQNLIGLAPHALTQRSSFAIPFGKKFLLNVCILELSRDTVAAPVGRFRAYVGSGASGQIPYYAHVESKDNTVNVQQMQNCYPQTLLQNGDTLTSQTEDTSTGGTVTYRVTWAGNGFDA